ncbi:hypothetical protein ANN_01887 [Periplaneta americana]|uniref:Uncharacterized protein n=1 Tax=Periplaneta americana TaxID=6978 RepID=A0ABQ8TUR6_PERAM|nr:hypothetical protein ANN_01887 [Periplaneta americana]
MPLLQKRKSRVRLKMSPLHQAEHPSSILLFSSPCICYRGKQKFSDKNFLLLQAEDRLGEFLEHFDIVLVDDQTMDVVNGLLDFIL